MAAKTVTHARRDRDGDIIGLGQLNIWFESTNTIITNIEHGWATYIVAVRGRWVRVIVRPGKYRKYLATEADGQGENNLDNLPLM